MRLLIVEDDQLTRELVEHYLAPYSSKVHYAESLEDCFKFCRSGLQFDLLILDLRLCDSPADNTADSIGELKALQPDSAVLVMSGLSPFDHWRNRVIDAGADGFLPKDNSFNQQAIYMAVFAALGQVPGRGNRTESFERNVEMVKILARANV